MIDAMRAALKELEDVLECINQDKIPFDGDDFHETLRTLRQAIAEAEKEAALQEISDIGQWDTSDMAHRPGGLTVEQEPVAWTVRDYVDGFRYVSSTENPSGTIAGLSEPLYTAPPRKEWVGLTDEEIAQTVGSPLDEVYLADFRRVIAKLKESNNG